jgi:hypothetical protein
MRSLIKYFGKQEVQLAKIKLFGLQKALEPGETVGWELVC